MAIQQQNNRTMQPTISIIIPTSGDSPHLATCLASIQKLEYPRKNIQTIVITNSDLEKLGKPFSFAFAVNQAAKKTQGKYLVITNDDIIFHPLALNAWEETTKRFPDTILGGKLNDKTTQKPAAGGYTMSLWTAVAKPVFTRNQPTPCNWVSGCALFINLQLWKKLDGFDEGFAPGFFEDADLCQRAKKLGTKCLLIPQAQLLHAQTATFNRNKPKKYEYWYRNKILFLRKHASILQLVTSLTLQYALLTPARAILRHDGRFFPAIRGLWWNIKHLTKSSVDK